MLSAETINELHSKFKQFITDYCFDRYDKLDKLYTDYLDRLLFSPVSSTDYYHGAFPGGYLYHVINVIDNSIINYKLYQRIGIDVSDFTLNELVFAALNHDLGKLGFPWEGGEYYVQNPSDWHATNQGKIYAVNPNIPHVSVPDLGLYILQQYDIKVSFNEYIAIKVHDGMYAKGNEFYYVNYGPSGQPRNNMFQILHVSDMAASRLEWETWNKSTTSKNKIMTTFKDKKLWN